MQQPTEREQKLIQIILRLLKIITVYYLFGDGVKDYLNWIIDKMQEEKTKDFELESLEYLKKEFGIEYKMITRDQLIKEERENELQSS